jgi:cobaltochelatase CobT
MSGAVRTEALRRSTAATTRALAREPRLRLTFGAGPAGLSGLDASLPMPSMEPTRAEIDVLRGEGDAIGLRLRFSDVRLHAEMAPHGLVAARAFDSLEQIRCETLGVRALAGTARNIAAALRARGVAEASGPLAIVEAVGLLAREKLYGQRIPEAAADLVGALRPWIESRVDDRFVRLADTVRDQRRFGETALALIGALGLADPKRAEIEAGEEAGEELPGQEASAGEADRAVLPREADEGGQADRTEPTTVGRRVADDRSGATGTREDHNGLRLRQRTGAGGVAADYRAFTVEYDTTVDARTLCHGDELRRLRASLDTQLARIAPVTARLASRLQRRLAARHHRYWDFDLEDGVLDQARLMRVVTNPFDPLLYKWERESWLADTVVSLLIDNSGSMRGRPIAMAAMCADILARTLERCGVKNEILGFTTRAWKGGKCREQWVAAGMPPAPGRLNDLLHIVYKSAEEPWRRARHDLGLMLRDSLLKENIDGEALWWAHERLLARPEQRRILVVVSDGGPLDDATLAANPRDYLERHVREVIRHIESRSPVELVAIGIRHDVTRYYRRSVMIDDVEDLGAVLIGQLALLFGTPERRG